MRQPRGRLLMAAMAMLVASCGGSTSDTTEGTTTTAAGGTTTVASSTTTTAVTTTAVTTTVAGDLHPTLGISWASVWPTEDATATYLATAGADSFEVEAHMEYGVDFRGMTVDSLVFGTAEPGNEGAVVYFDRSEPWVLKVVASVSYSPNVTDAPALIEFFAEPIVFDGTIAVGETYDVESEVTLEFPGAEGDTMGVTYAMTPATMTDAVTVPFGSVDGVLRLDVGIGGEFMGNSVFTTSLWLDSELFLVRFDNPPAWQRLELVEPWG